MSQWSVKSAYPNDCGALSVKGKGWRVTAVLRRSIPVTLDPPPCTQSRHGLFDRCSQSRWDRRYRRPIRHLDLPFFDLLLPVLASASNPLLAPVYSIPVGVTLQRRPLSCGYGQGFPDV